MQYTITVWAMHTSRRNVLVFSACELAARLCKADPKDAAASRKKLAPAWLPCDRMLLNVLESAIGAQVTPLCPLWTTSTLINCTTDATCRAFLHVRKHKYRTVRFSASAASLCAVYCAANMASWGRVQFVQESNAVMLSCCLYSTSAQ